MSEINNNDNTTQQPSQADIFAALQAQGSFRSKNPIHTVPPPALGSGIDVVASQLTTTTNDDKPEGSKKVNKSKMYCMRDGCGSCILSQGIGEFVSGPSGILPQDDGSPFASSSQTGVKETSRSTSTENSASDAHESTVPTTGTHTQTEIGYWYIPSSPFAFENIGFSRPDESFIIPPNTPGYQSDCLPPSSQTQTQSSSQALIQNNLPIVGSIKKQRIKWLICAECDLGPIGWSFEGGSESWLDVRRVRYGGL